MNLFLLENDRSLESVFSLPEYDITKDVIICFNYLVYISLKESGRHENYVFIEDLFTGEDYDALHLCLDSFVGRWYFINGCDETLFQGISLGKISQGMLMRTYLMGVLVKYGEVIRKAKEIWPDINQILFDFSKDRNSFFHWINDEGKYFNKQHLVENVGNQLGIQTRCFSSKHTIPPAHIAYQVSRNQRRFDFRKIIMTAAYRCLSFVYRMRHLEASRQHKRIYFSYYFNIASVVRNKAAYLITPPISIKESYNAILSGLTFFDLSDMGTSLSQDEKAFLGSVQKKYFCNDELMTDCDFRLNNINYKWIFKPAIENIVKEQFFILLKYIKNIRSGFEKEKISKAIITDIIDEKNKAFIAACQAEGVRVYFVDHGIQSLVNAHKSVIATMPDEYLTAASFPVYHIPFAPVVIDNPSLDLYPARKRKSIKSIQSILFLTYSDNFYFRLDRIHYQEQYFAEIFSTFKKLNEIGIKVLYRTHFENREYHEYLFDYFKIDRSLFEFAEGMPFSELIYKTDLLVCNVTNCYYEALAAGVPAVFMEPHFIPAAFYPPLNGKHGEDVLRVSTGSELLDIVEANQHDPKYLNAYLDNFYNQYAGIYLGKLDGAAGNRVLEYCLSQSN